MSTAIVLATNNTVETTSANAIATGATGAALAERPAYVAPKRFTVPAKALRGILEIARMGTHLVNATLVVQPTYSTNASAVNWSDGCKDAVTVVTALGGGRYETQDLVAISPWTGDRWSGPIAKNVAIVVYQWRGTRQAVEVIVSPDSMLLEGVELPTEAPPMSDAAATVIRVMMSIKSSYRHEYYIRHKIGPKALAAAQAELVGMGLVSVNKAGAVSLTNAGKNAARLLPRLAGL